MPKDDIETINDDPVIDECELDGFVSLDFPISPHVTFNLEKNKQYDSIREKKPIDMFYTRWEFEQLITRSYEEQAAEKKSKKQDASSCETESEHLDSPLLECSTKKSNTLAKTSFRDSQSNNSTVASKKISRKVAPLRRRNHLPLVHTYFGAPYGITQRAQMEAYKLWSDSDSSDDETTKHKGEGKKCCGLCVVQ